MNIIFENCDFVQEHLMKIYSVGFDYTCSLVFNGIYVFVKLLDNIFSNIRSKSILLDIYFVKKATYLDRK